MRWCFRSSTTSPLRWMVLMILWLRKSKFLLCALEEWASCTFSLIQQLSVLCARSNGWNSFAFSMLSSSLLNWISTSDLFGGRILLLRRLFFAPLMRSLLCLKEFSLVEEKFVILSKIWKNFMSSLKLSVFCCNLWWIWENSHKSLNDYAFYRNL